MKLALSHIAAVLTMAALLSACDHDYGPARTETRELTGFNAIDMAGAARVEITVGAPHSVEIEAPAEVLERVKAETRGETLVIETRLKDWFPGRRSPVTLRISTPQLASLRLGGGNNVTLQGFAGGASSIKAEGAAHIHARGTLDTLTVRMSGAGNADLSRLIATNAHVTVDGVGTLVVNATESLNATMNGVGTIQYTGSPRDVSTRMNGVGSITKLDPSDGSSRQEADEMDPEKLQPEYEDDERKQAMGTDMVI